MVGNNNNQGKEKLFNAVLNASYDGIFVINNKGVVIYTNKAISGFIGRKHSEIIGQRFDTLIEKKILSKRSISIKALKQKRQITSLLETKGKKILTTATPYMNEKGEVEFVVSNVRNIGELSEIAKILTEEHDFSNHYFKPNFLQNEVIKNKIRGYGFPDFNFESNEMAEICKTSLGVALLDTTILILGDSGVGKGILAQIIHRASPRRKQPMIEVNCAGFPEGIIDSELFGYKEGAFTGAEKKGHIGLIGAAHNSTLFLDEIGAMPLELQTRFLKFLDDGYILPLGSTKRKYVNVRVIAATNLNIDEQVNKGRFRKDLFFRLNVVPIDIPPLRKRREDIYMLMRTFLEKNNKKYNKNLKISNDAERYLLNYDYPGNVRELKNIIERLSILTKEDVISVNDLPPHLIRERLPKATLIYSQKSLKKLVSDYEREIIEDLMATLKSTYKVAKILEVNQSTIVRKMNRF